MEPTPNFTISVITVVKDDLIGLQNTFNSLVAQDYDTYEWIVIDGNSGEMVVEYLKSVSTDKVRWISEKDGGIYDAMNKGVTLCDGDYVVFMNAGDVFFNNQVLSDIVSLLHSLSVLPDVLFGAAQLEFSNGNTWLRKPRDMEKHIWYGMPANHQATYYRRASLPDPPYDPSYRICGDFYIIALMYTQNATANYIDKPLVSFKMDGVSFRTPLLILTESNRVQRTILHVSLLLRLISALKRGFSISMTIIISKFSI